VQIILPITEFIPKILSVLSAENNLILQAEPGAGKSTELPLSLLGVNWLKGKKILMLEPRRVAAKSIAYYLAKKLGEKVGQTIGYQIKNERKISKETILEIVTEGILTRRLQSDPEISNVGLIIFDEFHERSIHADLSLLLSLEVQQTIREDLKLLVMSATIDTKLMSKYMGDATVIECPGRAFPVSVHYANMSGNANANRNKNSNKPNLVGSIISTLRDLLQQPSNGDVLVFLSGQGDIKKCISECNAIFNSDLNSAFNSKVDFLPLYGGLPLSEQEKVLTPSNTERQRVIFSTNIAETSLTIEGVICVIDSGLEKKIIYDVASGMTRLETSYISKASAEQRKGRAGRTQPGQCIRLWNEQKQNSLKEYQGEEILSADLTGAALNLCTWGAGEFNDINWLTAPPKPHYDSAQATLVSLGLIDSEHQMTILGKKAVNIGVHPRLATMLLKAKAIEQCIASELAALQSDRDIFYNNSNSYSSSSIKLSSNGNGVDIVERLLALQDYKVNKNTALKTYPIKRAVVEQLLTTSLALRKAVKADKLPPAFSLMQLQSAIGKLLLFAYPERLAKRRSSTCGRYKLANGKGVFLFNDDSLFGQEWLVVADCDAQKKEGRIYSAAPISYETVIDCLSEKFEEQKHYKFDPTKQKILGRHIINYKHIEIKSSVISDIPPDAFQKCLAEMFKDLGLKDLKCLELLNWNSRCEGLLLRSQWLGDNLQSFPKISKKLLFEKMDDWLIPYLTKVNSIAALKKINIYPLFLAVLTWDEQQTLKKEAPTHYKTPSNKLIPIIYEEQKSPTVSVQLQELFGEIDSPKMAGGKVAIRFELLSPARRPIQTTSDLGGFWNNSYVEVAKEMRGRYPKHRWPEFPLLEKAGKSIRTRHNKREVN